MKFAIPAATALFLLVLANASQGAVIYLNVAADALVDDQAHEADAARRQHPAFGGVEVKRRHGGPQLPLRPMSRVPEQSAYSMLMIGLGLLALHMRRQPQEEKFSVDAPQ